MSQFAEVMQPAGNTAGHFCINGLACTSFNCSTLMQLSALGFKHDYHSYRQAAAVWYDAMCPVGVEVAVFQNYDPETYSRRIWLSVGFLAYAASLLLPSLSTFSCEPPGSFSEVYMRLTIWPIS
ncbi:hypothetical protein QEN58_06560 [Halomonas alkaliantarctica]|uniref:Uncharacterized protein n=1 Tax=Halomonas alkaliantarctica TaxID=232346 RepID=A0ABY8LTI5_9GAMM|nr:hypothetical protein [Halomonas alkaliantarctica]WGI26717.1 hypothetical protein QEN58_06560 [Halomonas alkaliantarctica]